MVMLQHLLVPRCLFLHAKTVYMYIPCKFTPLVHGSREVHAQYSRSSGWSNQCNTSPQKKCTLTLVISNGLKQSTCSSVYKTLGNIRRNVSKTLHVLSPDNFTLFEWLISIVSRTTENEICFWNLKKFWRNCFLVNLAQDISVICVPVRFVQFFPLKPIKGHKNRMR